MFDNFIEVLRDKQINDNVTCQNNDTKQDREIIHLVQRYPLLRSLISFYQESEQIDDLNTSFLSSLVQNTVSNISRPKNHYCYSKSTIDFSVSLYVLGGRIAYEFVRTNLVCALPSMTTLNRLMLTTVEPFKECEFR